MKNKKEHFSKLFAGKSIVSFEELRSIRGGSDCSSAKTEYTSKATGLCYKDACLEGGGDEILWNCPC